MLNSIRYIHGGAWRDPFVDSKSFKPAVEILSSNPSWRTSIAGFASINYRLSAYPGHPNDPSSPDDEARNAIYPTHLLDVSRALLYLNDKYKINNRYILAGHSAGGTLAFELNDWYLSDTPLPQPACVLGIAGIYDLEAIIEYHKAIPEYREFIEMAFPDNSLWDQASPSKSHLSATAKWQNARVIIIAHSPEDGLVEDGQAAEMLERAQRLPNADQKVHFIPIMGKHDEIWFKGHGLADLITKSVDILRSSTKLPKVTT